MIAEIDRAMVPASPQQAAGLAKRLIGPYRKTDLVDPAMYLGYVAELFAEAPVDLGKEAVKELVRTSKWLPSPAEVAEALAAEKSTRRAPRLIAEICLKEHSRRAKEQAERDRRDQEYREWVEVRKARYGEACYDAWQAIPISKRPALDEFAAAWQPVRSEDPSTVPLHQAIWEPES